MTPAEIAEIIAFAREAIQNDGRAVTFYRFTKTAPNNSAPHKYPIDPFANAMEQEAYAVFVPVSSQAELGFSTEKRALFNAASVVALVEPIPGVEFSSFDAFSDATGKYNLTVTDNLQPGLTPLLWAIGGVQRNAN